jgi:uncharacterized protein YndB with AHSA1/START domain
MVARSESEAAPLKESTTSEPRGERETVVTRMFDASAHLVFEAWTKPDLFRQWWVPKSSGLTLLSCAQDVRVGGSYRLEFAHPETGEPIAFFGRYLEVVPNARVVWTNEESDDGQVTTVTFEEKDGRTLLVMSEVHPSQQARDAAIESMGEVLRETLEQLDAFLASRGTGAERS